MPRVPTYDSPQVRQAPLPAPRLNLDTRDGSEAVAQGLAQASQGLLRGADVLGRAADEERAKQNAARVMEAYARLGDWQQRNLYAPKVGDQEGGALQKRGEAALPLMDLVADFEKTAGTIEQELTEEQRPAFRRIALQERESVRRTLSRHVASQADELAASRVDAAVATATSNAANGWKDKETRRAALELAESAVLLRAQTQGWPGEKTAAELARVRTQLHLTVLERMTDAGAAQAAEDYLKEYGPEMEGAARARSKVDEVVTAAVLRERAAGEVAKIRSGAEDYGAQLEAAQGIEDVPLRDAVVKRLQAEHEQGEKARKEVETQRLGRVYSGIEQSGGYLDEGTKDFALLSDDGQAKARTRSRTVRWGMKRLSLDERRTQQDANKEALARYESLPEEQQRTVPLTEFPEADKTTLFTIQGRQNRLRKDHEEGLLPDRQEFLDLVSNASRGIRNKKGRELFESRLRDWRVRFMEENDGKAPSAQQVREALADSFAEVSQQGLIFDTSAPRYQVGEVPVRTPGGTDASGTDAPGTYLNLEDGPPTPAFADGGTPLPAPDAGTPPPRSPRARTVADVPASERRRIEAALRTMKRPISDAEVLRLYNLANT